MIIATISFVGEKQIQRQFLPASYWKNEILKFNNIIEYAILLLFISLLSGLSNLEIEKSLKRARKSELDLRNQRDNLEIEIQNRTNELKLIQFRQISQMTKFAEIGKLASGHYHDLLNPLTALSLSIEDLRNKYKFNTGEMNESLNMAMVANNKMASFISTMRQQVRQDEFKELFDPKIEVKSAISLLKHKFQEYRVESEFLVDKEIEKLLGVPLKFYQIVVNLISNAIESYEQETIYNNKKKIVIIKLLQENNFIILNVIDYGSGISNELLNKIFTPFYSTKINKKGLGIGLYSIKSIIENDFHGSIEVDSILGVGSTFEVKLPILNN